MKPGPFLRVAVTISLALALASLLGATPPAFWSAAFFGAGALAFIVYVPTPRLRGIAAGLGIGAAIAYSAYWKAPNQLVVAFMNGLGAASVLVAAAYALSGAGRERRRRNSAALAVALFPVYLYVALAALGALSLLAPPTFDGVLSMVDRSIAGDASFTTGRWLAAHHSMGIAAYVVYQGAPIVMVAAAGLYRLQRPGRGFDVLLAIAIAGAVGFALYAIVPAAGPIFRWGATYPQQPPGNISLAPVRVGGYPNAIPSVHAACAIIVLIALWPLGIRERAFALVFVGLTGLSTLGLGEHYLVDLIVGAPFGVASWLAIVRSPRAPWWICLLAATTLAWLLVLRFDPEILFRTAVIWAATFATIAVSAAAVVAVQSDWGDPMRLPQYDGIDQLDLETE